MNVATADVQTVGVEVTRELRETECSKFYLVRHDGKFHHWEDLEGNRIWQEYEEQYPDGTGF